MIGPVFATYPDHPYDFGVPEDRAKIFGRICGVRKMMVGSTVRDFLKGDKAYLQVVPEAMKPRNLGVLSDSCDWEDEDEED